MAKIILGETALREIKDVMRGLCGAKAGAEAKRLAAFYSISRSRIYELSDDVRPSRSARCDKKCHVERLFADDNLIRAAELVAVEKLTPELALEYAALNGAETAVSLTTFRRLLNGNDVNRQSLRSRTKPHRRWEAAAPMDLFQFDISSVKERWFDYKTKTTHRVTILDDSKNHPYGERHPTRVRLWKFCLVDDFSRRRFVRFYAPASGSPDATLCIEFLLSAFREMGVPKMLYTDRDTILRSERMTRAAQILNQLFVADGGFSITQHLPGNAQATGKVERSHQIIETHEPLINLYERSIGKANLTIDDLNVFAVNLTNSLNHKANRTTGEVPMLRWNHLSMPLRIPPSDVLDMVFTADEHQIKVNADVTVSFDGVRWQLPRTDDMPFVEYAVERKNLQVVTMRGAPFFLAITADGATYELEKIEATADTAGDFKSLPETRKEKTLKRLQASHKARRAKAKEDGTRELVPGFDSPFKVTEQPRPVSFPKPIRHADPIRLVELAPAAASLVSERRLDEFQAIELFQREGLFATPISREDKAWFKLLFQRKTTRLESDLRAEIETHRQSETPLEIAQLRRVG